MHMFLNIYWWLNCHNKLDTYDAWSVWVEFVCFELKFSFFQNLTHQPKIPSISYMNSFFSPNIALKLLFILSPKCWWLWAGIFGISNCYISNKKSRMRSIGDNKIFFKLNYCRMWADCLVLKKIFDRFDLKPNYWLSINMLGWKK